MSDLRLALLVGLLAVGTVLGTLFTFSGNRPALAAPPINDSFADSTAISEPLPFADGRNTSGATTEVDEPSPCSDILSTVWYRFTPSSDLSLGANTVGSDFDTVLAVYTGSAVDSLSVVACNDDISFPDNPQSEVAFAATAGVTYHFQVGGFSGETGNLVFNVTTDCADGDSDCDGFTDGLDNCPSTPNATQANADGDQWGDACDNCPGTPTPWIVPPGDSDCDAFTDEEEGFVGTDAADACPDDLDDDAWPADLSAPEGYGKHDGKVNILDIVQLAPPAFGSSPPDPNYSARKDFNGDGVINILDIVRLAPPTFGQTCTP